MAANEQGVQSASGMQSVTVNMVSDVVCPWCIVGYQRLQEAIKTLDNIEVDIKFHPFQYGMIYRKIRERICVATSSGGISFKVTKTKLKKIKVGHKFYN